MITNSEDDVLMAALQDITACMLEPQLRAQVARLEREGLRVTVLEVRETGAVLVIAHAGERPTMAAIRAAYQQQQRESAAMLS